MTENRWQTPRSGANIFAPISHDADEDGDLPLNHAPPARPDGVHRRLARWLLPDRCTCGIRWARCPDRPGRA